MPLVIQIGPPPHPIMATLSALCPAMLFLGTVAAVAALAVAFGYDDPKRRRTVVALALVATLFAFVPSLFYGGLTWLAIITGRLRFLDTGWWIEAFTPSLPLALVALAVWDLRRFYEKSAG